MARTTCVETAAVRLMLKYPFWCELYYSMKIIEDESIHTLATDGKSMWVCPSFFNALSLDYKVSALAHESCHKMLHHCTRGIGLLAPWANIAMDIVVNTMLHENGFKIHPDWVQPEAKYSGWTFERVYQDITKNLPPPPPKPQGGQGKAGDDGKQGGQQGEAGDPNVPGKYKGAWQDVKQFKGTPEQVEHFEEAVEQMVQQAIATAKAMGNAPAGVDAAVAKANKVADEHWYDHLQRFFQSLRLAEYDWAKVNRRYAMRGVIAPSMFTERLGEVVVFVDASGSCYDSFTQAQFASHINAILSEAKPSKTHVAYFDAVVHKHVEVEPGVMEFEDYPCGGGGTSFAELIPWMEEQGINPSVVIILTDMYGTFPKDEPTYPVIWASTSRGVVAPFGETIYIQ